MKKTSARDDDEGPRPVDIHVGKRLRQRRTLLGMSQEKLGEAIGVTFQQVQKYENGANRVSASRLHEMAQMLNVPVSYFFEEMSSAITGGPRIGDVEDDGSGDTITKRETLELVRAYFRIGSPELRKKFYEMVVAAGENDKSTPALG